MTDPNGKPSFLAVDLNHLDPAISPIVEGLLSLIQRSEEENDRADFRAATHAALNRAYGDDEPDYDDVPDITNNPSHSHE